MDQPVWKWNKTVNTGVFLPTVLYEIDRQKSFWFCVSTLSARWQCSFGLSVSQWRHWIFSTSFLILCARAWDWNITVKKKKRTTATRKTPRLSYWNESFIFINRVLWPPWGQVLAWGRGAGVLWVWRSDCRKAQEMNVLSARAKKTRLQRGRRNKYLNLTHLLVPSQTKQAEDSFLSSNKTRFSLGWWGLPLLNHFHIWYLEWEYSAWLVETVGLDLWCLLSRAALRLCSTGSDYSTTSSLSGRQNVGGGDGRRAAKFRTWERLGRCAGDCSRFVVQCSSVKYAALPLRKLSSEELLWRKRPAPQTHRFRAVGGRMSLPFISIPVQFHPQPRSTGSPLKRSLARLWE